MEPNPRWRRYSRLCGPDRAADAKDELQFHLECLVDELVDQGWSPADARRESARRMGDLRSLQRLGRRIGERTEHRKRIRGHVHDSLWDLRYTIRGLRRDSGFTAVCILILALAIGATSPSSA